MKHEKREAFQQEERLSPDIIAFCTLVARIMMRCLRQHDTRMEKFLFLPDQSEERQIGGTHDPTMASKRSSQMSSTLRHEFPF